MRKTWMTATMVALASAGAMLASAPVLAQPSIHVQIGSPPPPLRYEVVPQPRRGHVWVPGHWQWAGNRHVWVNGHFLRERPGYVYHQPVWVQDNGRWVYRTGNWARGGPHGDRDRDGIPNRYDRNDGRGHGDRDRDGIRNRHDRDRDGDGVPNRFDNKPNNPNRR